MNKYLLFVLLAVSLGSACGGSVVNSPSKSNSKTGNVANVNSAIAAPANLPAGISTTPLSPRAIASNVPAANGAPRSATTPGIPSPAELKKQAKPGTTPTPGIPSADEMRKAFAKPASNADSASPPMMKDVPMMRSTKPANKP